MRQHAAQPWVLCSSKACRNLQMIRLAMIAHAYAIRPGFPGNAMCEAGDSHLMRQVRVGLPQSSLLPVIWNRAPATWDFLRIQPAWEKLRSRLAPACDGQSVSLMIFAATKASLQDFARVSAYGHIMVQASAGSEPSGSLFWLFWLSCLHSATLSGISLLRALSARITDLLRGPGLS